MNNSDPSGNAFLVAEGGIPGSVPVRPAGNNSSVVNSPSSSNEMSVPDKIGQSVWSVISSITLDAGIGIGGYAKGNVVNGIEGSIGGYYDAISVHYSYDDGINIGSRWEKSLTLGFAGFETGPYTSQFTVWKSWLGEMDSNIQDEMASGIVGVSAGIYLLVGFHFSVGFDTNEIITDCIEIWGGEG